MKVLVIGLQPAQSTKKPGNRIKKNTTFDRLNKWMSSLSINNYSFINLFSDPDASMNISRVDKNLFISLSEKYDVVFGLGMFVHSVLKKQKIEHLYLPHPSPRNRLFNDKEYEPKLIQRCKEYLEKYNNEQEN